MKNLLNSGLIRRKDPGQVANSILALPQQIQQVLDEMDKIKIPDNYKNIKNIVINGMGGSNIGAYIAKALFFDVARLPIDIVPGYDVPAYVNEETLFIISSYSGTTEEPLSVFDRVKKLGAKIMIISASGHGTLEKLAIDHNLPNYIFEPKHNPCGQPRLATGYSIFGFAALLAKAGVIKIDLKTTQAAINKMLKWGKSLEPNNNKNNPAKNLCQNLKGKSLVLVSAEHLSGNIHALRNQINETGKLFCTFLTLPDLNHFAMEGLINPSSLKKDLAFVFFDSSLFNQRIQTRSALTKKVVAKNDIQAESIKLKGTNRIEQSLELLQFGAWMSFYFGMLYDINPVEIPFVDWFKKNLKN